MVYAGLGNDEAWLAGSDLAVTDANRRHRPSREEGPRHRKIGVDVDIDRAFRGHHEAAALAAHEAPIADLRG